MAKQRERVTPIVRTEIQTMIEQLKIANNELLPSEDEALQGISKATNKPLPMDTPKTYGRPPKEAAKGRVKFTTAVQPSLVKWLKIQAANTGVSVADVVEQAFAAYKHEKDMNK
jgi:predicted HicB family RNase H-like nuclease